MLIFSKMIIDLLAGVLIAPTIGQDKADKMDKNWT